MAETKKRKSRDEAKSKKKKKMMDNNDNNNNNKKDKDKKKSGGDNRKRRGIGLPNSMRKVLDRLNHNSSDVDGDDEDVDPAEEDVYEYEEGLAQEDSKRNRRFDPVENLEPKLPDDFEVCLGNALLLWILRN